MSADKYKMPVIRPFLKNKILCRDCFPRLIFSAGGAVAGFYSHVSGSRVFMISGKRVLHNQYLLPRFSIFLIALRNGDCYLHTLNRNEWPSLKYSLQMMTGMISRC
jgi:hypothetical protein